MLSSSTLLDGLTLPVQGRSRRISSNEQPNWNDGNFDMTWLNPGETLEMPVLEGPGLIRHIWMTSHSGFVHELNALSLRIYWDGRDQPGVEAPLGDFFAVGHGVPTRVESVPVQVSPTGSLTCYWTMPFARSARIVIRNDNPDRGTGLYWQIDWTSLPSLPPDILYFHARYRQEFPAVMGRDYEVAAIEGRGQYVGTVLSVTLAQDGWFGEGDEFFTIDGETIPSLQGTGTEDYFNDAWGFRPRTGLWFGQPRWQGDAAGDSGVCYRWHIPDPVSFERSLRLTIEHKGNRPASEDGWYIERPDFLSSVAFWYQSGVPAAIEPLPDWPERRVPWIEHHLVRAFRQARWTGSFEPRVETRGFFGGRPALVWPAANPEARLELQFDVPETGRYAVRLTLLAGGAGRVLIDDKPVPGEFSVPSEGQADRLLGVHDLTQGRHWLGLCSTSGSVDEPIAVEMIRLLALPPEATRARKTHNEAHFIRLGIGRAAYAYRLAYGEVPPSLEALQETGLLESRYRNDENGAPLRDWMEDGCLVVETAGPGGWRHCWRGLDARR